MKAFDQTFGPDFIATLPATPGVYLLKDRADRVIYVGKAKNLRRRRASYRGATRRKAHRKMRAIVRAAASLEVRLAATESDALLLENELIRTLRPELNVDGKFTFLYPVIGLAQTPRHTLLGFTTDPEAYAALELHWYGCFRSRRRARAAFESLDELLGLLGHREKNLRPRVRRRGSSLRGYRQLGAELVAELDAFLSGRRSGALGTLALRLLEKPRARREASDVQDHLRTLADFYESDLEPLHRALREAGVPGTRISQSERDPLFLRRKAHA